MNFKVKLKEKTILPSCTTEIKSQMDDSDEILAGNDNSSVQPSFLNFSCSST